MRVHAYMRINKPYKCTPRRQSKMQIYWTCLYMTVSIFTTIGLGAMQGLVAIVGRSYIGL